MTRLLKKLSHRFGLDIRRIDKRVPLCTNVHFLHVGKTGGTELKRRFAAVNKLSPSLMILSRGHQVTAADLDQKDAYLISLRNPVSRFESAFHSLKVQKKRAHTEIESKLFKRFPNVNDIASALDPSSKHSKEAINYMLGIRHFSQRQADFVRGIDFISRPPMFIFRAESLDLDFVNFCNAIGINPNDVPSGNSNSAPRITGLETLDERNSEKIQRWYMDDVLLWRSL